MADKTTKSRFQAFHGGQPHFRAARTRCAIACQRYNSLPEDATAEQRASAWRGVIASNRLATKSLTVSPTLSSTATSISSISVVTPPTTPQKTSASAILDSVEPLQPCESPDDNLATLSPSQELPNGAASQSPFNAARSAVPPIKPPITAEDRPDTGIAAPEEQPAHMNLYPGYGSTPYIKPPLYIDYGINVSIGGTTFINRNCTILDTPVSEVRIGERCLFGPNVSLYGVSHPLDPIKRQDPTYPESSVGGDIIIGDNCWIGGNVIILAGVTIGNACVVGAGSVVTKSIPPNSVAYGCPARVRKKIEIVADRAVSRGDLNRADLDQGQISLPLPRGGGGEERFVDDPVGTNRTAKLPLHRIGLLADAVEPGPSRTEILLAVVIFLLSATVIQLGVLLARK